MSTIRPLAGDSFSGLVRDGDAARPIVFLHGIGGNAATFGPLFSAWTGTQRLLAWDAPGYGDTPQLAIDWPVAADYADALAVALADVGVGSSPIGLVGHSLGCLIAAAFARRYPARVHRLALMAPALGYQVSVGGMLPDSVAGRIAELETLGAPMFAARRAPRLVQRPEDKRAAAELVRAAMAGVRLPGYRQAARMLGSGDLLGDAETLACPVLVLNGAEDVVTPTVGAARLLAVLRARARTGDIGEDLILVPDAGHAVSIEHPAVVAAHLRTFLEARP